MKRKRLFLKRVPYPSVTIGDLFLGSTLLIYARQLKIVDFCDSITRARFGKITPFLVLVPHFEMSASCGAMLDHLENAEASLRLRRLRTVNLTSSDAREISKTLNIEGSLAQDLSKSTTLVVEMTHPEGARAWTTRGTGKVLESKFFYESRVFASSPSTLAAIEMLLGGGQAELSSAKSSTATFAANATCCLIKPHALRARVLGNVVGDIVKDGRWTISAIKTVRMNLRAAESFLEVYRGVVSNVQDYANELSSSACVAMEILPAKGATVSSAVSEFRKLAGPFKWDFASRLRPKTLRAKYGISDVQNGIHCTDLESDGVGECKAAFGIGAGA
eukprot:g3154.t1